MAEKRVMVSAIALLMVITLAVAVFLFLIRGEDRSPPSVANVREAWIYGIDNDYRNENVKIRFSILYRSLRDVGDPNNGLTIKVYSGTTGLDSITADVRGELDYAAGYVEKSGFEAIHDNMGVAWRLYVPVTQNGSFEEGMAAELLLWTDNDFRDNEYTKVDPTKRVFLNEGIDIGLAISCFDSTYQIDAFPVGTSIS